MPPAVAPRRPHRRRRRHRVAVVVVAVPFSVLAVLVLEAVVARRGGEPGRPPLDLDTPLGPGSASSLDVVWLGDSTASGVGASDEAAALPSLVMAGLGRPVRMVVLARSGATVADVVEHQLPAVAGLRPDVVFVSVGANDVTHLTSGDDFEGWYRRLVSGLPGSADVVVLGVPDMGAIPRLAQPLRAVAGLRGDHLDDLVRDVATDSESVYVDIAGETGPIFRADPDRFFSADRYHPSDAGYRRWADAVLDGVRRSAMLGR